MALVPGEYAVDPQQTNRIFLMDYGRVLRLDSTPLSLLLSLFIRSMQVKNVNCYVFMHAVSVVTCANIPAQQ